jgi:hypothetical protein
VKEHDTRKLTLARETVHTLAGGDLGKVAAAHHHPISPEGAAPKGPESVTFKGIG